MKITVYTTSDCQFSKQEKDYLTSHSLQYEEKNLETNKNFLTEMLAISNNFAGTPVTRVEKDDGSITVLKGFTKEEFDTTLGLAPVAPPPTPVTAEEPPKVAETPPAEVAPPVPVETTVPVIDTPTPPVAETPEPPIVDEKLNSVLDKLEDKTVQPTMPPAENPAPTAAMPTIPEPDFK